jgi:hypothetical protein
LTNSHSTRETDNVTADDIDVADDNVSALSIARVRGQQTEQQPEKRAVPLSTSHIKSCSEPAPSYLPQPTPHSLLSAIQGFDKRSSLTTMTGSSTVAKSTLSNGSTITHPLQRAAPNSNMLDKLRNVIQARRQVTAFSTFKGDASDDENDDW